MYSNAMVMFLSSYIANVQLEISMGEMICWIEFVLKWYGIEREDWLSVRGYGSESSLGNCFLLDMFKVFCDEQVQQIAAEWNILVNPFVRLSFIPVWLMYWEASEWMGGRADEMWET